MSDMSILFGVDVGNVLVRTTSNRGFTPEEIAERALDKIVYVGSQSHPAIRDQAEAAGRQQKNAWKCSKKSATVTE